MIIFSKNLREIKYWDHRFLITKKKKTQIAKTKGISTWQWVFRKISKLEWNSRNAHLDYPHFKSMSIIKKSTVFPCTFKWLHWANLSGRAWEVEDLGPFSWTINLFIVYIQIQNAAVF